MNFNHYQTLIPDFREPAAGHTICADASREPDVLLAAALDNPDTGVLEKRMGSRIFRVVYCSRNTIAGTPPEVNGEIGQILVRARANNAAAMVTGALLYNSNNFAQVLEGSADAVGAIFEKIQRDPRHSEVRVVESGFVKERLYGEWSMAFSCDRDNTPTDRALLAFNAAFAGEPHAGDQIVELLRELVQQNEN